MKTSLSASTRTWLFATLLTGLTVGASAQVTVSTSTTAPSENLLFSFTTDTTSGRAWRADSRSSITSEQWRDIGQIFVAPEDSILKSITVVSSSGTNAPARGVDFTITLFSFGTGFSVSNAEVIGTWSGVTPDPGSIPGGTFFTFNLPDTQLTAGVSYGFLLHFEEMADSRTISLRYNGGSGLSPDTRHLTRVNGSEGAPGSLTTFTSSLEFYVQAVSTASIPEPSSGALLLGAGALAFGCTRHRARR
jgi:PEP-CTERM motif.